MISSLRKRDFLIVLVAVLLSSLDVFISHHIQKILAYPSASVAGFFFGTEPILTETYEVFIPISRQWINVSDKCSAFDFACLLYAMLVIYGRKLVRTRRIGLWCLVALPATYIITIFANGARIIGTYQIYLISQLLLPAHFQDALHQGVGIAIFLTTLILISLCFERVIGYD